ncbi:MAG TPA: hypothetical protein VI643_00015 [Planctomycetota bacterium]|nr:hypothetical protein [Planctomycetota bacterium]
MKTWVLYVWHGCALKGPVGGSGAIPEPGDRLPALLPGLDHPIQAKVIRLNDGRNPTEVIAVTSDMPSSRPAPWKVRRSAGAHSRSARAPSERITLSDVADYYRRRTRVSEGRPVEAFRAIEEPIPPEPEALPETIGRDEPDLGAIMRDALGRDSACPRRLLEALIPTLRAPLRSEIRRLAPQADRGRLYLADRFRRMLRHLNALERTVASLEPGGDAPRLARWLVSENVMLREEIRGWLGLEERLGQKRSPLLTQSL